MLSIQEVGKQILTGNPKHFYIFVGNEYGIKEKYLDQLKKHYQNFAETESLLDLLELMQKKRVIPLQPKLYIVRYDESFIQTLDKLLSERIHRAESHIIGTIVCMYELPKHVSKCMKYMEHYTVSFDGINKTFIKKYLTEDFPNLNPELIDLAVQMHTDYQSAYYVCLSMNSLDQVLCQKCDADTLSSIFGTQYTASEQQFRYGVASRNFGYCLSVLENYNGQPEKLLYTFLSTLLELEKLISNPSKNSDLSKYQKCWSISDIYYMFLRVYQELENSRAFSSYDVGARLIYLIGMMQFSPIPEVRAA